MKLLFFAIALALGVCAIAAPPENFDARLESLGQEVGVPGMAIGPAPSAPVSDRVGQFVDDYLKKKQIPGCAVMVRENDKVVLSAGYGIANLEHGVRVTPRTIFQSGSLGKQFRIYPKTFESCHVERSETSLTIFPFGSVLLK